jgi:hypothetical protein
MKRDLDCCRAILLAVENFDEGTMPASQLALKGYTQEQLVWNARLPLQGGFLEGHIQNRANKGNPDIMIGRLTWAGCDFADASRDEGLWSKATAMVKARLPSVAFSVLKSVLVLLAKEAVRA